MNLSRWNVGSGMPEIDPDVGTVILMFSRHEVEGLRSGRAVDDLMQLSDSARLRRQLAHGLFFSFDGYNDDPREVHQIPECRQYLQAVHSLWPYWLHFLAPEPGMWSVLLLCLAGGGETVLGTAARTGHSADGAAIRRIVQAMLTPMNLLHAQMGLSDPESMAIFTASMSAIEETLR